MAVPCPYCQHSMNPKGVRPGRFTPKCPKCGRSFQLVVAASGESFRFEATPLAGDTGKSASFDPNVTAPSAAEVPVPPPVAVRAAVRALPAGLAAAGLEATGLSEAGPTPALARGLDATAAPGAGAAENADFSIAASAVQSVAPPDDRTMALETTSPPRPSVDLDSTDADSSAVAEAANKPGDGEVPPMLGGYQIVKELGRGGMGAVYLARQVSLDRPVALKVMNTEWASNPNFLVRFTREAYAAAQLVHHNVVQVYDIGEHTGINYFSMEYVEGSSLGDLLKKNKRLAGDVAAGYILQAARGLKFAHDRGMIHRDIKPDNLMLNDQGIVKVADLGLVRTPGMDEEKPPEQAPAVKARSLSSLSNVTLAGQAMGTPSYMAPEQARDATTVDHRADIYSLGCTLFVLVTGKPVFQASSALEMMTRHATEPVVPPHQVNKEVSKALSDVVVKMLAKKPEDRYPSMDDVVKALEDFLGLQGQGKQAETEKHVRTLEEGVRDFLQAPAAQLRSWVLLGFLGGTALLFLILLFTAPWRWAGGVLGLGVSTILAYAILHGSTQRSHLFLKCRDLLLSATWVELGKAILGTLLFVGVLWLFGLLWVWILACIVGIGLALGMHYTLDRKVVRQRGEPIEKVEKMLRTLRLRGLSEEALHEFVSKYSGEHWEEFFEAMFGYEAKLAARQSYGTGPKGPRPRAGAWRDPVVRWLDAFQRGRQEARERQHLQAVEQKNLVAQGVDAAQAREKAAAVANAMVEKAAEIKKETIDRTVAPEHGNDTSSPARKAAPPRRVNVQDLFQVAAVPPKPPVRPGRAIGKMLGSIFGGTMRFALGAVLLMVCLLWLRQNGLTPSSTNFDDTAVYQSIWSKLGEAKPLALPLPEALSSINTGAAGLVLLLSCIWRSWKIGILTLLGAAVMILGPGSGLVPSLGMPPGLVSLAAGAGVALLGFLFGRDT